MRSKKTLRYLLFFFLANFCFDLSVAGPLFAQDPSAQTIEKPIPVNEAKEKSFSTLVEQQRQTLFSKNILESECRILSKKGGLEFQSSLPELSSQIELLVKVLKTSDEAALVTLFHPRLKIGKDRAYEAFSLVKATLQEPYDFSIYRVWLLNTPNSKGENTRCAEDSLSLGSHFGYKMQAATWIQILGSNDLARIYVSWVPVPDLGWRIGAWHFQRWTHVGSDPESLRDKSLKLFKENKNHEALLTLDLASKLLDYKYFLYPDMRKTMKNQIAEWGGLASLFKKIKDAYPTWPLERVDSLYAEDGVGLNFTLRVPDDQTMPLRQKLCLTTSKEILNNKALALDFLSGVRCAFVLPKESIERDGKLGGRYYSKAEVLK